MLRRSLLALALLALAACSPRLDALTEQDQAPFAGFTCTAVKDGRVIYITDGETGLVRYKGRPLRLSRFRRNLPFDPGDTDSLMMASADGSFELSFRGIVQAPGASDDATESFTRPVMLTVEDRGFGGGRLNMGAELVCAS
jgi:hypothetical protein